MGLGGGNTATRKESRSKNDKEEIKSIAFNLKKIGLSIDNFRSKDKSEKEFDETTGDQLTPRLENPVSMLRRKRSSNGSDNIPNERPGPIRLIPCLNVHRLRKFRGKRNMSQLLANNKSGFTLIVPSIGSHE